MNTPVGSLSLLCLTLAALCLYLASPHQKLVQRPLPGRALALTGIALGVSTLALLNSYFGPAIAVFILVTGLMLLWSLPPLAIAWLHHKRQSDNGRASR
ncbi:hypothetical protein FV139_10500 [Parahaliea maris]|uniref:DUF3325 domain-containing protein n=1 Tax=Parahaliea maris TaxID=2716870 RepID=A0A5C8ZZJ9_9GAMM|nr:hypothetical protein [Parahaliea maris]TXS94033.1 hypothetical protein FV139_10500 [Parahaliea maris]